MFVARAHDVLTDVDRLRHVHSEANNDDMLWQVVIAALFARANRLPPLRAMIFSANTTRQRVVDIQRKPITLRINASRRAHAVLKNRFGRCGARPVKRQDDVVVARVLDVIDEAAVQRRARHGMFIQAHGKLRRKNIVPDAIWCANLIRTKMQAWLVEPTRRRAFISPALVVLQSVLCARVFETKS